jgi:hypothetical protein
MNNSKLWIVGKITNVLNDGWDFIGVFSDEPLALSAVSCVCTSLTDEDKSKYFIAPAKLNEPKVCADGSDWEGGYFPFDD